MQGDYNIYSIPLSFAHDGDSVTGNTDSVFRISSMFTEKLGELRVM